MDEKEERKREAVEKLENLKNDIENEKQESNQTSTNDQPRHLKLRRTLKGHYGKVYSIEWGKEDSIMFSGLCNDPM